MKYIKKVLDDPIEAHQWLKNGDHPLDRGNGVEGTFIRHFRRPDIPGYTICTTCGKKMKDHGWVDDTEGYAYFDRESDGVVCPGDWVVVHEDTYVELFTDAYFKAVYDKV